MSSLQWRDERIRSWLRGACVTIVVVTLSADRACSQALPRTTRLKGTVTVAGTNLPVAGATVGVVTGMGSSGVSYDHVETKSDAGGRYSLEIPMGHGQLMPLSIICVQWTRLLAT